MADQALSSLFQTMTQSIVTLIANEIRLESGLRDQLKRLKACVERMGSTFTDMEHRQNRSAVAGTSLSQLRDVAHDAKDLLDELQTEINRRANFRRFEKVRNSTSLMNPKRMKFRHRVDTKMKSIEDRVTTMVRDKGLNSGPLDPSGHTIHRVQSSYDGSASTTLPDEYTVFGREKDTKRIVDCLTTEGNTSTNPSVLSIQAIGGTGKSTLAREVYHKVMGNFDLKMWVPVSRDSNRKSFLRSMVVEIQRDAAPLGMDTWDVHHLQEHLNERIRGRKYLLVLDGMWKKNLSDWECLKRPLLDGARSSWIVVTTRNKEVARTMSTGQLFCIEGLSHDDCWNILAEHAFEDQNEHKKCPELEKIGKHIARKCNGSPLAAKILGDKLQDTRKSSDWQAVLDSNFSEGNSEIVQNLKKSYDHFEENLKQCFRFCSIFPKGFLFQRDILILLWMAQDFIPSESNKRTEDKGNEYFTTLLQESFFEQSPANSNMFVMNDLIHDVAKSVSRDECGTIEHGKENYPEKLQHLSVFCRGNDSNASSSSSHESSSSPCLESAYRQTHLWTLIFLSNSSQCFLSPPGSLYYKHYEHLRALDLTNSSIRSLNKDIRYLKYLRCLNLSNTKIESLPESLNELQNLQSLLLRNCYKIKALPRTIRSMYRLRHLDLHLDSTFADNNSRIMQSVCDSLVSLPEDIGKLTQLQTLSRFILKKKNCGIEQLEDLNELHGDLLLTNLQAISEVKEAAHAKLYNKVYINRLKLQWTEEKSSPQECKKVESILDMLKPNPQLEEFWIEGYSGKILPSWISGHLSKLVRFTLFNCKECESIQSLGQLQCLKELYIGGMYNVKNLDCNLCSHDGTIPALKKMVIDGMPALKEWSGEKKCGIPFLCELVVKDCPELLLLTHNFPLLEKLAIDGCPKLECLKDIPSLRNLDVKACGEWIWYKWHLFSTVSSLKLSELPTVVPPASLNGYDHVQKLEITHCDSLACLTGEWLPRMIKCFIIKNCSQLQTIAEGMENLTCLEEIEIQDCERLTRLPDGIKNLWNLEFLVLSNCPMLSSLPSNGLPTSLQALIMKHCPLLKQHCNQNWQKFQHIPLVCIDGLQMPSAMP